MKKIYLSLFFMLSLSLAGYSQFMFDVEVDPKDVDFLPNEVMMPPSPLKFQVLFVGGVDKVQTTPTYGNEAGEAIAKQWHDFIGFTPDTESDDLGWISVNHEMKEMNDSIGDGGGMTVFKVKRNSLTDEIEIVDQTLNDGRSGKFFNVDFVNTVGETGMNCGGIVSPEGRIWTAEEWWVSGNDGIVDRDTSDFTIGVGTANGQTITPVVDPLFKDETIKKYQNKNWMVEIDPKQAVALRKQYNWGRQAYEGGAFMDDNKIVYLTEDNTPGLFSKFVADEAGDFTKGTLYVYKHDGGDMGNWIEMNNGSLDEMLYIQDSAYSRGASMFNRLEWATQIDGKIYMTETARDNIVRGGNTRWGDELALGGQVSPHIVSAVREVLGISDDKPDQEILDMVTNGQFNDYYGRVLVYDPATDMVDVYLNGGPYYPESPDMAAYPDKHLGNPDGLSYLKVEGKTFMIIAEDLNGTSNGRVPAGISNRTCELFLLDMSIADPTVDDLIRISVIPQGAEVTGPIATPDGKTVFANSQHPNSSEDVNNYPFNNSLTYAITGWDFAVSAIDEVTELKEEALNSKNFTIYPNPVSRTLNFNEVVDVALYDAMGKRIRVARQVSSLRVDDLKKGVYLLKTNKGFSGKVSIQ
ncbi:MAG: alkaline phosphatase PhoX [Candidatus Cyclobacteriaceae bacterium M3_2C_046]